MSSFCFNRLVRSPSGPLSASALSKHKRAVELMFDVAVEHDLNVYTNAFFEHYWIAIRAEIVYLESIRIKNFKMLPYSFFDHVQPDLMMRLCPDTYFKGVYQSDDFVRRLKLTPMLQEIHKRFKRLGIKMTIHGDDIVAEILSVPVADDTLCPITKSRMKCPVVASDGHTYEKEANRFQITPNPTRVERANRRAPFSPKRNVRRRLKVTSRLYIFFFKRRAKTKKNVD